MRSGHTRPLSHGGAGSWWSTIKSPRLPPIRQRPLAPHSWTHPRSRMYPRIVHPAAANVEGTDGIFDDIGKRQQDLIYPWHYLGDVYLRTSIWARPRRPRGRW